MRYSIVHDSPTTYEVIQLMTIGQIEEGSGEGGRWLEGWPCLLLSTVRVILWFLEVRAASGGGG